ncbi:hypothetical protein FOWG_06368 [Fusarium oxysporum f. sp. lycopersici MN25]|nr:hypothetical protein FOWG_06368 [Fusarium oxysporum f. sp. lycopersici MN25]
MRNRVWITILHALSSKPCPPLTEYLGTVNRGCVAICTGTSKELKPNMPYTDAALCTAQPHVGESTVICNLAVTFEDQDVPSSSEGRAGLTTTICRGRLRRAFRCS